MANFYNAVIPRPEGIPATVEVRVFAGRVDGGELTAEELAALRAVFPSAAPVEASSSKATPTTKARRSPAGTKARKPAAKRAAAKRP